VFRTIALALRLLARDWRAGELTLIGIAVAIAVASVTSVGFFTDRVRDALHRQANQLMGADLVVVADRPLPPEFEAEALRRGLAVARMTRFPSMVVRGDEHALASVKAVSPGYPLRGEVRIAEALDGDDRRASGLPAPGAVWVDARLYAQLALRAGETIGLGDSRLRVEAILTQEPDSSIGFVNAGPSVLLNESDLAATGLLRPGSRVQHRLQLAGPDADVAAFRAWLRERLQPGQRVEGIRDARPEVRSALDRAEKFVNLAALVSVLLAAAAIALAARRFLQRHLDGAAVMRCLGASQGLLMRSYLAHFLVLGVAASAAGCALGVLAQFALAGWLGSMIAVSLPAPGFAPAFYGLATGLALLLGFALPPLAALARVPPLRVVRRELGAPGGAGMAAYVLGLAAIGGMILWRAGEVRLAGIVFGGFVLAMAGAALLVWLLLRALAAGRAAGVSWRFGIANLRRRALGSIVQVVALGVGIMALLTLTLVRGDLMQAWQASLPPDAPNRFIINIQPDQLAPLAAFFAERGMRAPEVHPMVRGRLTAINGRGVSAADYADERARRLVTREFNLSWARRMPADNRIVAGRWWDGAGRQGAFSVEDGIAETLGIRLGDVLTYDIAGRTVSAPVASLRRVDWDSFNVNFFVIAAPGLLEEHPVNYITSFHLPRGEGDLLNALVKAFPNFVVIDVAQVMARVQRMMEQAARAVQFLFLFTLAAGILVLYAAIASTQDERLRQATIMRTLGASRGQLARVNLAEFAAIGALAGLVGAAGASGLGYFIAHRVLNLPYGIDATVWLAGVACGAAGVALAGYLGTRRVLDVAPLKVLRSVA
jgi:putative ABC transport system permease protein